MTGPCCIDPGLGYEAWHADAERRKARGEKQEQCPGCGKYNWPKQQKELKEAT